MIKDLTSLNPSKGRESKEPDTLVNKKLPGFITADLQIYKFIKAVREELKENPTEAEN